MEKIKVLIVDDSTVIRSIIKEVLSHDDNIHVVGEAKDPFVARDKIKELNPDVLTLDVEMPKMDGITFLKNLMRLRPMPVVMLSTLTTKGADTTLEALEIGAVDFIAKPSVEMILAERDDFKAILIDKIKSATTVDQKNYQLSETISKQPTNHHDDIETLTFNGCRRANHIVAIGASTGGTEAIKRVVKALPANSPPVVITLHIPETFSERFASRLNVHTQVTVMEAKHGQKIKEGHVYVAPGHKHLKVMSKNGSLFCTLDDSERVNRHRPAVDVLFNSLVDVADNVQAYLLTGMGNDGAQGLLALKTGGARTVIQDKKTSLIWGMPGSAHKLNAQTSECALEQIPQEILTYAHLSREQMRAVIK